MATAAKRKPPEQTVAFDMTKQLAAAEALKFQLTEIFGEGESDTELLRDAIEGETQLFESVDSVLKQIAADQCLVEAIKAHAKAVSDRKSRIEKRIETMRTMLASALEISEQPRFDRPLGVITLKAVAPKLVITDEAQIPSQFWTTPEPELAKKDLLEAIKSNAETFAGKLKEIDEALASGAMDEAQAAYNREKLALFFPTIPGVELDNGGVTVQIRFS